MVDSTMVFMLHVDSYCLFHFSILFLLFLEQTVKLPPDHQSYILFVFFHTWYHEYYYELLSL